MLTFNRQNTSPQKAIKIAAAVLHYGEEPPISGSPDETPGQKFDPALKSRHGSGTIFFSNCNLACIYCQNYEISQEKIGKDVSPDELLQTMLDLQDSGAHNINLVSPTHVALKILPVLAKAKTQGLKIPVVYNTNGTDRVTTLKKLEGLIDVYLPDMKYGDDSIAKKYSHAQNYVTNCRLAINEMYRQVGPLVLDKNGIAHRGLMVRHLVLPNRLAGSFAVLDFLASVSSEIWLSLMSQYYPTHRAKDFPEINRPITAEEYQEVVDYALALGFENILGQELSSPENYRPNFKENPAFS